MTETMSDHVVTAQPASRVNWLYVAAGVVVAAALVAIVWGAAQPISVTVNGRSATAPPHATLRDLRSEGLLGAKDGALFSVTGAVLKASGGEPARITRNGHPATLDEPLFQGDVVESHSGGDVFEKTVVIREAIPVKTVESGAGSVVKLAQPGAPGIKEVTRGVVSGTAVATRVIKPSQDMVVVRSHPSSTDKLVALTFDDGPWPGQTDKILDILRQEGVKATFFMLGSRVKASPSLAKRVAAEGHSVGNHTLSHKDLTKQKPAEIRHQIVAGADTIARAVGTRPVWFRPPFGAINRPVLQAAKALKVPVVLWDIDTNDWRKPGVPRILRNAEKPMKPGSVVLMHDGGGDRTQTIAALPTIIRDLKAQGYTFVTLDELAAAK